MRAFPGVFDTVFYDTASTWIISDADDAFYEEIYGFFIFSLLSHYFVLLSANSMLLI